MMHDVSITKVLNGYSVIVGCQTLVFQTQENLLKELKRYLDNPEIVEKEYCQKGIIVTGLDYNQTLSKHHYQGNADSTIGGRKNG